MATGQAANERSRAWAQRARRALYLRSVQAGTAQALFVAATLPAMDGATFPSFLYYAMPFLVGIALIVGSRLHFWERFGGMLASYIIGKTWGTAWGRFLNRAYFFIGFFFVLVGVVLVLQDLL